MLMSPLVAACALAYLLATAQLRRTEAPYPYREALLWSVTGLGVFATACTELLGALDLLTPLPIAGAWLFLSAVLALGVYARRSHLPLPSPGLPSGWPLRLCLIGTGLVLAVTGFIALIAPPNTWDSMTYHLPRVMHWMQNRNVDFYPTHIYRQLQLFPAAEYFILHLQLLSGADRFANLVQWLASLVSITGVSLIAGLFTAKKLTQALAALLCAALPMGIMQATSTQNDYVAAAFLICFSYFMLRWSDRAPGSRYYLTAAGCALGLGMLTKPTLVCFFPAVFLLAWVRHDGYRRPYTLFPPAALVGLIAVLFSSVHFARLSTFPIAGASVVSNAEFSPQIVASNLLRGITLHTNTPWWHVNQAQAKAIRWALVRIGIAEADPRNTWQPDSAYYAVFTMRMHEDHAGNGLHLLLSVICFGACCWKARKNELARRILPYGLCLLAGLLTFWILFRWQPWASRLQLPLFVLGTPFIALVWSSFGRKAETALSVVLIAMAIPHLLGNESRPLAGNRSLLATSRGEALFNNRPELAADYTNVLQAAAATGCNRIGMILGADSWEYPVWTILQDAGPNSSIQHVAVTNGTDMYARPSQPPCAVISDHKADALPLNQQTFHPQTATESLTLYLP